MLQDADGTQDVPNGLALVGEVRRVTEDGLGLCLEFHLVGARHGGLDADSPVFLVEDLVDLGVEHVGAAVDGREAGEALGQLAEAVERIDVRGLAVAGDRVAVEANALEGFGSGAGLGEVVVVGV